MNHSILHESIYAEELFRIKQPTIVVLDQAWESIPADEMELLKKILKAVKQSIDSIQVKVQSTFDISTWKEKANRIIYFGQPLSGVVSYEVLDIDGVSIVVAECLHKLMKDDEARKKLWQALKRQFDVK